jgi:hypothetical protein
MSYKNGLKATLPNILAAAVLVVSSPAAAAPVIELTATNTATNTSQTFTGTQETSPDTQQLDVSGDLGDYSFSVNVTATDEARRDELFDVNIDTTTDASPEGRLELDLIASGYTGFSGPTPTTSVVTPSSVVDDLDIQTFVDGSQVLNAQNIPEGSDPFAAETVSISSPYAIRHLSVVEHNTDDTSTFDTTTETIPVPSTLALLGAGLVGLGVAVRRRSTPARV